MRVNVYAEEMTDRIEIIAKEIDGQQFTGLRFYLELPVTMPPATVEPRHDEMASKDELHLAGISAPRLDGRHVAGPFMHRLGDDDSAAVTFWGKRDLRRVLHKALALLDKHYEGKGG